MSAILKQKLIDIANGFTKYGLWKGGSSKLSELDDVTLTNLQSNDVLTYNGSVWTNDDNLQKQIDTLNRNLSKKASRNWNKLGSGTNVDISGVYSKAFEYFVIFEDVTGVDTTFLIPYQLLGEIINNGYYYEVYVRNYNVIKGYNECKIERYIKSI